MGYALNRTNPPELQCSGKTSFSKRKLLLTRAQGGQPSVSTGCDEWKEAVDKTLSKIYGGNVHREDLEKDRLQKETRLHKQWNKKSY